VNISVHAQDNARSTEYFNRKQKFGLGYKPMTFVSEVKYDDVSKVYYHEHRETTQLNRDYPNVKFMLKRFLSEDLHLEAQNIAKKYAQILWEKKYFNALHTFPIILEQLTKQKTYWQELYEDEFIIRRNIEIAFEKKKKIKQDKLKKILVEYKKIVLSIKEVIYTIVDDEIRDYFLNKLNYLTKKTQICIKQT